MLKFTKEVDNLHDIMRPFYFGDEYKHDYAISTNCYEWYYSIAKQFKPKVIAEIGVRYGYSSAAMLLGYRAEKLIGYDMELIKDYNVDLNWTRNSLSFFNNTDITIIRTDTQKCLELPLLEHDKADLIHVDGDHSKHGCLHDLELSIKAISDDGIILIDDIDHIDLKEVVELWADTRGFKREYLPTFRGMIIIFRS